MSNHTKQHWHWKWHALGVTRRFFFKYETFWEDFQTLCAVLFVGHLAGGSRALLSVHHATLTVTRCWIIVLFIFWLFCQYFDQFFVWQENNDVYCLHFKIPRKEQKDLWHLAIGDKWLLLQNLFRVWNYAKVLL